MAARSPATIFKALWQLGPRALAQYGLYALQLRSGWLRAQTPPGGRPQPSGPLVRLLQPAQPAALRKLLGQQAKAVLAEADAVLRNRVRLFGGEPRPLKVKLSGVLKHWSAYTRAMPDGSDIKLVWEVGRLGWATLLARAYWLSGEERYAEGLWRRVEHFVRHNPPNLGPHWSSAQEVALRLISLSFSYILISQAKASTPERAAWLSQALAGHAERIPPSLSYARAQNNNHLLSEAVGLWTAGLMLPQHPKASAWRATGRANFIEGIRHQVAADGAYSQHSANYQRLMLQLAVWAMQLAAAEGQPLPGHTLTSLRAACTWLFGLLDEDSGQAANLGPNDGAYILPFSVLAFHDYRPALQAAAAALNLPGLQPGAWDELRLWLGLQGKLKTVSKRAGKAKAPLRLDNRDSWAYLRAAHFDGRPGHADQLHLDLWWRGFNIAQDAGTYLYNAPNPWNNALAGTEVHNTLMLDDAEQMSRAGRFLWLDWAQATVLQHSPQRAVAQHNGYRRRCLTHRRSVQASKHEWIVKDEVLGDVTNHRARLHWLLPDWPWRVAGDTLHLRSPQGRISIQVAGHALSLLRAGKRVYGTAAASPTAGWISPTYASKQPALALVVELEGDALQAVTTRFVFPK
ncbi:MAG: alginate lyase family protein [Anaerolineales bacterium]|nr:MAG: alginate lyase family protein [Anaerolineales bacterium]